MGFDKFHTSYLKIRMDEEGRYKQNVLKRGIQISQSFNEGPEFEKGEEE